MWSLLVLVPLMLQSSAVLAETAVCAETKVSSGTFSVVSRRNQTGHWLTQVSLSRFSENQPPEEQKESGAWQFDLSFSRSRCGAGETLRTTAFVTVPPSRPGPGYELHAGIGYYKLHPEGRTWAEAAAICEAEGTHLVIINSEQELKVIKDMFARYPDAGRFVWLGFHDKFEEGQYLTIHGESLTTTGFMKWSPNEPNNLGGDPGEDCGSLVRELSLNDYNCNLKSASACEQEL